MQDDRKQRSALSGPIAAADPEELVGNVIDGRYRIKRFISQGGMGAVYEAEHVTIQQSVAVKVVHRSLLEVPDLVRRFEREAFAIGRIDHPNCIRVSDFGSLEDGSLFLVMEYLDGVSLADIVDHQGALPLPRALRILRHVLRGLAHIHRAQIVHRDIKPENIMVIERDGDKEFAKVLDFGIAKLVGDAQRPEDHNFTQAGVAFGTPTYMSPEQTLGSPVDFRSDLYQACTIFYEMLAGRPPFYSDDKIELMAMQATKAPPPVREFNPRAKIVPDVQRLLDRGLAKRAKERFQTADEFLDAVDGTIARLGVTPPPHLTTAVSNLQALPASPTPARRITRRLAVGALALMLVALVAATLATRSDSEQRSSSPVAEKATDALERGNAKHALSLLDKATSIENDSDALLVAGHAHAVLDHPEAAIHAYERVLELRPTAAADAKLRANVEVFFNNKSSFPIVAKLRAALVGEDETRRAIAERAVTERDGEWRHLALTVAEELGFADELDLVRLYSLDLVEGRRCRNRREAVAKLRAIGDPNAIPALHRAIERKGTRGRLRGQPLNSCLVEEAMKAIQYLEALRVQQPR